VTDAKSVHPAAGVGTNHPVLGALMNDRSGFQGSTGAPTSGPWVGAPLDAQLLRSLFSSTVPGTVGFDEGLLLVHRGSWLPADAAATVAGIGYSRVKPELPACQLEIATFVHEDVAGAIEELRSCRALLAAACDPDLAAIAAPVHPLLDGPTDVQATVDRTSAIARLVHALAELHHLGELQPPAPTWRIAENRWAALRDGVRGKLLDLRTGEARPTRRCLHDLIDAAEPYAPGSLADVRAMVEDPPVEHLRALGPERVVPWLAEVFTA
jgi:gamma-glutamyl:cysteine ligase YbdK (ATP-grasp superfamily)